MPYRNLIPRRQPHEIVLTAFIGASSLPGALGLAPLPASLRSETSGPMGRAVLCTLALGCLIVVVGNLWPRPSDRRKTSITALLIERLGLVIATIGSFMYAGAAWSYTGPGAGVALGFVLGFAVASSFLVWRITLALRELEKAQ